MKGDAPERTLTAHDRSERRSLTKHHGKAGNRPKGFTLLELLVAMTLTGIVLLGLMAVFRNMLTVYAQVRESRESATQARALVGLLGDDLRTLVRDFSFIGRTGESGERVLRLLEFASGVSVERQEAEPALTQVLVVYSLARVGDEEWWTLMRSERPHPSISGGWRESPMPLLQHVDSLKFYFELASGAEQDFCSVPPGGVLPAFVRMEAVLRHDGGTREYSLRFPVGPPGF
ncbi:MAG: prepilin-type N-terminal cleavage/methylation domain-containing protein [Oscillospiraceae bacterium]|nr:prepilin-type N-terminal cleavage/methylation domain-containing protein [Oscillospiraceae bacterium]